jgi:hypothetical protein
MDKYLKLMQLLSKMEADPDPQTDDEDDQDAGIEAIFERLQQATDAEGVRTRLRQAAAATGSCFEGDE